MNDPADRHKHEDIKPYHPPAAARRRDPMRLAIRLTLFVVVFYGLGWLLLDPLFRWFAGNLAGPTVAVLLSAVFATWLALRVYEDIPIYGVGLWWNRESAQNLKLGLIGGIGAAVVALLPALATGAAHIASTHSPDYGGIVFCIFCVLAGSAGEEIFFRGYGFQILMAEWGPWAAILPVGVVFGLMHGANPNASPFGLVNTAGFGILFGYAFYRSRDLWLPIGLHFGWNVTLPLFGANLSGITIFKEVTGLDLVWRAGKLWSGGEYGPEASILTSAALVPLFVFLWKAPIRRQRSPLTDPSGESDICDAPPRLPS